MALVRCESCGVRPPGSGHFTRTYVRNVRPLGHPHSGLICGTPTCKQPGLIWLEQDESDAYDAGERIFHLQTNTTRIRAQ